MSLIKIATADEIRKYRKMLGLTQKQLASKSGLSQSLISRIENNDLDPRLSTIRKIVNALTLTKKSRIAADIMHSPVFTVEYNDTIKIAVNLMKKFGISQIPVLRRNKIIGSIREATVLNHITKNIDPDSLFSRLVYEIMDDKHAKVQPSTLLDHVIYLLSQGDPAVLVVDNEGTLLGIITKIDIISSAIEFEKEL
ncbi:MAG: CBS domain-containing protein [Candidatus Hermodarchaeia archaeon]